MAPDKVTSIVLLRLMSVNVCYSFVSVMPSFAAALHQSSPRPQYKLAVHRSRAISDPRGHHTDMEIRSGAVLPRPTTVFCQ